VPFVRTSLRCRAVLLSATASLVAGLLSAAGPAVPASAAAWSPETVPALPGVSGATGLRTPRITNDVIDGSLGVATSTTPILTWKNIPAGVSQVKFVVEDLSTPRAVVLWSKTAGVTAGSASAAVDPGVMSQGRTYRWLAESTSNTKAMFGPFFLSVDTQRLDVQPTYGFGGLSVAEATGEPIVDWTSPALSAVSGAAGYTLVWRPSNTAEAGLPPGWNLDPSGSVTSWRSLVVNADSSVTVSSDAGPSITFKQVSAGDYQPVFGADQTWPQGEYATLVHNANGTWSVTDLNSTVTEFSATSPTSKTAWPETAWSAAAPHLVQRFDPSGRLVALTDPVSHASITFSYAPAGCAAPAPGFATAPAGMLCAVTAWDGTKTVLSYVTTPGAGVQLGRITANAGTGSTAESTDLGWDNLGRVVSLRQPLADDAIAAGVVGGLTASDPRATTSVSYDTQGRVTSITAPAGLVPGPVQSPAQQDRARQTFAYDPFVVRADHVTTPTGWIERDVISPSTMLETASFDAMNRESTTTWNVATSAAARELDVRSGLATTTTYSKVGLPVSETGPTAAPASPAAPHTTLDYDTDYSKSATGTPLTGLSAFYFRGTSFNDTALALHQTGPLLNSSVPTSTPANLVFQWAANPVGTGPWSARLTGNYTAPATGEYRFTTNNAQKLWVGAQSCAPTCTVRLDQGAAVPLRIDVVAQHGTAGVNVTVTTPSSPGAVPVPMLAVSPAYDQPSSEAIRDVLGPGDATRELKAREITDPSTGKLTRLIQATGATDSFTYAPYNPSPGSSSFGQPTSVTSPDGKTVSTSSYTGNQHATAPCPGAVPVPQRGLPSRLNDLTASPSSPPNQYAQTYNSSGLVTSSVGGGTTTCASYDAVGDLLSGDSAATGLAPWRTAGVPFVNGNPLVSSATVTTTDPVTHQTVTLPVTVTTDINGTMAKYTDEWGTTSVFHFSPYQGNLTSSTQTTAKGFSTTTAFSHEPDGSLRDTRVDGTLLSTDSYRSDGRLARVTYANGTSATLSYGANGNESSVAYSLTGEATAGEADTFSPAGRVLTRTLTGPDHRAAVYRYSDDANGRLVSATESGTIPVTATSWSYGYGDPRTSAGNRLTQSTTTSSGTISGTSAYDGADRLTSSTDPAIGHVSYDPGGRATTAGPDKLTYDAAGNLTRASDGETTVSLLNAGTGIAAETVSGPRDAVAWRNSGQGLILNADGSYAGRIISLDPGVDVLIESDGRQIWRYTDLLGNAAWTVTGAATSPVTTLYDPFGQPITHSSGTRAQITNPAQVAFDQIGWGGGQTLNLKTPLMAMGARTYAPAAGRFLQPDPQVSSTNAYEFAGSDPINASDVTGATPDWLIQTLSLLVSTAITVAITAATAGLGVVKAALIGAAVGALIESSLSVAVQTATVGFDNVSWGQVGTAAAVGFVSGGLGGALGAKAKLARNARRAAAAADLGQAGGIAPQNQSRLSGAILGQIDAAEAAGGFSTRRSVLVNPLTSGDAALIRQWSGAADVFGDNLPVAYARMNGVSYQADSLLDGYLRGYQGGSFGG
jgi:RHS repeat-associated protein